MTKTFTAGETYILSKESTDNPKLCAKRLTDGRMSLYLNYYLGYHKEVDAETGKETIKTKRSKESLNLYLYNNPRTVEERRHNKEVTELAKRIRFEKELERIQAGAGYRIAKRSETDFLKYYREYIDNYTKKDLCNLKMAYRRFVEYLSGTPKYKSLADGVRPAQLTKDIIIGYTEYLQKIYHGEGAHTIYARFKKVVKHAFEHDFLSKNPCVGVTVKIDVNGLKKEILSIDEIRVLVNTPFQGDQNIKRAFLFSLYTGIRWCDVKELTFANVDYSNKLLTFTQKKTENHSAHSSVTIPLNENLSTLIGEKREKTAKIFALPSYELSCRYVKMWVKRAGIDKNISWHCARHSFAVNVLNNGANIKTVSSLLGHSSIAMTEKYLHVVDNLKRAAIDSLPAINL